MDVSDNARWFISVISNNKIIAGIKCQGSNH